MPKKRDFFAIHQTWPWVFPLIFEVLLYLSADDNTLLTSHFTLHYRWGSLWTISPQFRCSLSVRPAPHLSRRPTAGAWRPPSRRRCPPWPLISQCSTTTPPWAAPPPLPWTRGRTLWAPPACQCSPARARHVPLCPGTDQHPLMITFQTEAKLGGFFTPWILKKSSKHTNQPFLEGIYTWYRLSVSAFIS